MKFYATLTLVLVIICWAGLTFSGSAMLVGSDGPTLRPGDGQASFKCTYFNGTGTYVVDYWHSDSGILGVPACPRIHRP